MKAGMALQPLAIKLRFTSWAQISAIYERDLKRERLFIKTQTSIALGREVRVDLVLPSGTMATLEGRVAHIVPPGDRGPGVELILTKVPPSHQHLHQPALPAPPPAEQPPPPPPQQTTPPAP